MVTINVVAKGSGFVLLHTETGEYSHYEVQRDSNTLHALSEFVRLVWDDEGNQENDYRDGTFVTMEDLKKKYYK